MPYALEFPRMLRPVIKLMSGQWFSGLRGNVVDKLVALPFWHSTGTFLLPWRSCRLKPGLAAVIRALNHLPKPSAGLRSVNPIGIEFRSLHVISLPAGEMRAADLPFFSLAIGTENEGTFFCS